MHILLMEYDLHLPDSHSLKEKRRVVKPILNALRRDFNVSASEVASLDAWQHCGLALVAVGNLKPALERIERNVTQYLETLGDAQLVEQRMQWV